MNSEVLALKCRPRDLDDVVGQEVVVQTLKNSVKNNRLHHAYLFVGQYGSGKTSMSRILAAMENCSVSPGLHPCGKCDICESIFNGKHEDILEIDAASNAGKVDQIRELKNNAMYSPVDGAKVKYFIIDEIQAASGGATEALLKLVEEPPSRTRFILCTTDINKVKGTIQSRCQRHDFSKIHWMSITESLQSVCKKEGIDFEIGAINKCARLAHGSMRNAVNNLDKVISFVGEKEKITSDLVDTALGTVKESLYYDLVDELIGLGSQKADAAKAFKTINTMLRNGADYKEISNGLGEHMQVILMAMTSSKSGELVVGFQAMDDNSKERIRTQIKKCQQDKKLQAVMQSIKCLSRANEAIVYGLDPELALQMWFVEGLQEFYKN